MKDGSLLGLHEPTPRKDGYRMNDTTKHHDNEHRTIIPTATLRDPSISNAARGLLVVMLSYPDGWKHSMTHLRDVTGATEHAVRVQMRELIEAGYVQRKRVQGGWDYVALESLPADDGTAR